MYVFKCSVEKHEIVDNVDSYITKLQIFINFMEAIIICVEEHNIEYKCISNEIHIEHLDDATFIKLKTDYSFFEI